MILRFVPFVLAILILLACIFLSACAVQPYRPYTGLWGYSDAPLETDVHEVSFAAADFMSVTDARYYATLRAAEIARQHGRPHFEVIDSMVEAEVRSRQVPGRSRIATERVRDRPEPGQSRDRRVTTVEESPPHIATYEQPVVTLFIRLLEEPTESGLSTDVVLQEAVARGIFDS